jgi:hypothetical protein
LDRVLLSLRCPISECGLDAVPPFVVVVVIMSEESIGCPG